MEAPEAKFVAELLLEWREEGARGTRGAGGGSRGETGG